MTNKPDDRPAMSETRLPAHPFENKKEHFDAYVKVRDIIASETKYRRDRQWEIIKWVTTIFLAIIGLLFTLMSRQVPLNFAQAACLTGVVAVISLGACLRIIHDAGVVCFNSRTCIEMDKSFHLHFDDSKYKLSYRMHRLWLAFLHGCDKRHFKHYAKVQLEERKRKTASSLSFLVWCYVAFILSMAILTIVTVWSCGNNTIETSSGKPTSGVIIKALYSMQWVF